MKKQLLLAGLALFLVTGYTACKKENESTKPLRSKMLGKWQVNSVKTEVAGPEPTSETINYTSSSFIEFKDNEDDDVELTLNSNRTIGSVTSGIDNSFYIDLTDKDLDSRVISITQNKFEFVSTRVGSNPKITETYSLSR